MYSLGMASVVFAATQLALSAPTQLQEYARGEHQDPPLFNEDPLPPPPQPAPTLQSDKRKPFAVKVKQHSNTHMSFKPKPKPKPKPEPEPKRSITPDMETATVSQRDIEDGNDNGESNIAFRNAIRELLDRELTIRAVRQNNNGLPTHRSLLELD